MEKTTYSILAKSLQKSYKGREVLKDVSFFIPKGIIYALLGSNGAGKTTTMRILTAQIEADGGEAKIEGYDIAHASQKIHEVISLTGQFSAVDENLTGKENLTLMGRLRQLENPRARAEELLSYFQLSDASNRVVASYSGGMKRKLDIAMSLVGSPRVIFLDEPTTALDPQSRHDMWDIVRALNHEGVTVFLTTQYLEEAEQLADVIGILNEGRIIAEGTPSQLKKYLPQGALQFTFAHEEAFKKARPLVSEYKASFLPDENKIVVFTDGKADTLAKIFHVFYEHGICIGEFSEIIPTLEDVFLEMIRER